ncbi:MAG: hypothetical protein H7066_01900 [Cytophagaceae bacterium]|nr:hypothetical protein [Gemmatimonadaceae bacterium]
MAQLQPSSLIAGSVLPIKRAEELLATLPGVIAARIIAGDNGAVDEIHVLTTADLTPKQTVRNIESALIAHLGMRVDHRKISVATSIEPRKAKEEAVAVATAPAEALKGPQAVPSTPSTPALSMQAPVAPMGDVGGRRAFYFEDVEVSRSRTKGLTCRVTLTKGGKSFMGEAEGMENDRSRVELAAKAAMRALAVGDVSLKPLELEGARVIEAFDREFVFVGVTVQHVRASVLLTGSCELKESPETASVLAVLDATNRWLSRR